MEHHTCTFVEEAEPSGRLIIGPCLECGLSAFDALKVVREIGSDRFAGIVAMRDKLATSEQTVERLERENECKDTLIETLQAQLAAVRETVGEWCWNIANLTGDYNIRTVEDFNNELTRRALWLQKQVQATLPPPQSERDKQRMRELEQQVAQLREAHRDFGVHLSHCNFGEHEGVCKYGKEDVCPALTPSWEWFGKALSRAEKLRAAHTTLRGLVEKLHPSLLVAARNYITQCYCKDKNVPCTKHDAFYVEREHLEPLQQLLDSRTMPRDGGKGVQGDA